MSNLNANSNDFDAIVVGSGISGGWAAKELTDKGLKVALIERGENTIHGIILSYFQCKIQREQLALLKNVLNLSRKKYEFQATKNELGLGVTVDLLQFKSAFLTDSSNLILQELAYKNSIRNLNLLLGVDVERNWNLTDELNPPINIYNFEDLIQQMLSNNTNIKNQLINVSLLKQDIEMA